MQYIVNAKEMKQYDSETIEYYGIPAMVLMERAALAVTEEVIDSGFDLQHTAVFCGSGNNGGDGIAIARLLFQKKINVCIILAGNEASYTDQTRLQLQIAKRYGVPIIKNESSKINADAYTTIIDAIFGIGISRKVEGGYAKMIESINHSPAAKIAVDIPSGICTDTGRIMGCAVKADITVTFAFLKIGLFLYPGTTYAGKVILKNIGITEASINKIYPSIYRYQQEDLLNLLPKRYPDSNKGTYGKVTLVAGSFAMAGAAFLAGEAAYKTGCGLVRIVTPEVNRNILQTLLPEAVLTVYDTELIEEQIIDAVQWSDVVGIGSGIGTGETAEKLLEMVLKYASVPIVIDADGLNIIAKKAAMLKNHSQPVIVTPHIGEMSRLTGKTVDEIKSSPIDCAKQFAKEYQVICVLKDARTVVASPQGDCCLNTSGNDGMSTAGSGDVLMGVIAGLSATGAEYKEAATAGVWIHGLAGDKMIKETGKRGLLARDIITGISKVIRSDKNEDI